MKHLVVLTLTSLFAANAYAADSSEWQDLQARTSDTTTSTVSSRLQQYRVLSLDETAFKTQVALAAEDSSNAATQARSATMTITLPLPDGTFTTVTATQTQLLTTEVANENPDIQTWKVQGTDGKILDGVIDFTTLGFHAMLTLANGDTIFIDPEDLNGARQYVSFSKQANADAFEHDWHCATLDKTSGEISTDTDSTEQSRTAAKAGERLNTYDLAIAATAEYTAYFGSQANALSAIVTTINRVNAIYERDLSIHFNLVTGTSTIYTDASSDPYTNGSASSMIDENQKSLDDDNVLGSANYDIGHVFGVDSGGNGLAVVEALCDSNSKAMGMTSSANPTGDAFDIDFVAHEIGHQVGGTHTFNGTTGSCYGNRQSSTAFEPGSGSSIMAYAGICGSSNNLQSNSDAMFHAASIAQILSYTTSGTGASCATASSLSNTNPTVSAGSDYTIPAGTPFVLTGSGSDTNGDTLTYAWDQIDAGTASDMNVDKGDNALFRSHLPSSSASRTFPQMSDLVNNTASAGEYLPVTSRYLNFRLEARDGKGGTAYDDSKITAINTGSAFAVTYPTSTSLTANALQSVTWNVASTDQAPINCSTVNIDLSTDSGSTFTTLLAGTTNNGSASVTLPSTLGTKNYLRVKCTNNVFFALSATSPAKASTSSSSSSDDGVSISSSGGGGSVPMEWLCLGGAFALYRLRQGRAS